MRSTAAIVTVMLLAATAGAQLCEPEWLPGDGIAGINGRVDAVTTFDPDGPGPAQPLLIAAGAFTIAGGVEANNIAAWDGESWSALGDGLGDGLEARIVALISHDDGSGPALYAGGFYNTSPSLNEAVLARWNGSAWEEVGGPVGGSNYPTVSAFREFNDGSGPALYMGGFFSSIAGVPIGNIAKWNGKTWAPVGTGTNNWVSSLEVFNDGAGDMLYAGGNFTSPATRIARWNGQTWAALAGAAPSGSVWALKTHNDGGGNALYAGGNFTNIGSYVARWRNNAWSTVGGGVSGGVHELAVYNDGGGIALYAGGQFLQAGGGEARRVARFRNGAWSALGSGANSQVDALGVYDDGSGAALIVGGLFSAVGELPASGIAQWSGAGWSSLGERADAVVRAFAVSHDAFGPALFAGGDFNLLGGSAASRVAQWDGYEWAAVGDAAFNGSVRALAAGDGPPGDVLYAAGDFTSPASYIARWDGSAWSALGQGVNTTVRALLRSGGLLYAGGSFNEAGGQLASGIAVWNGAQWSKLGTGVNGTAIALAEFDPGSGPAVYVGGSFTQAGGQTVNRIARWSPASQTWSALGAGFANGEVHALATYQDLFGPALYAAGTFTSPHSHIARWNGSSWTSLAAGTNGPVYALAVLDLGDGPALYAAGDFTSPASHIARWDGVAWSEVDEGMDDVVYALMAYDPDGSAGPASQRLFAGGEFTTAGGRISGFLAQYGEETNIWAAPTGGQLSDPASWLCGRALSAFDNMVIDRSAAGYGEADPYTITLAPPVRSRQMRTLALRSDEVSINMRGSSIDITSPSTTIARPGLLAVDDNAETVSLTFNNAEVGAPSAVSVGSLLIADAPSSLPGAQAALTVTGNVVLDVDGDASIGRRGQAGALTAELGATVNIDGDISIGVEPQASGSLRIEGPPPAGVTLNFMHSETGRSMVVGQSGDGTLEMTGGAQAMSTGRMRSLVVGAAAGSEGSIALRGAGTKWIVMTEQLIIGRQGHGELIVENGATLSTTVDDQLLISAEPGATGRIDVVGAGSEWTETAQQITVGAGGALNVLDGGLVTANSPIVVRRGGVLAGNGQVGRPTPFTRPLLQNVGVVRPQDASGAPDELRIVGDYEQLTIGSGEQRRTGRLEIVLDGAQASTLVVDCDEMLDGGGGGGDAMLRGGLLIDVMEGATVPSGSSPEFMRVKGQLDGRFDVVFLAGQPRNERGELLALAVQYPTARGSERGFGDTLSLTTIATVAIDVEGAVTQIDSTGLITDGVIADLNGDGLNDLALTILDSVSPDTAQGSVVILYNGGDNAGEWQGFTGSLTRPVGPNPSSIAAADLNNDTFNDLVVTNAGDDTATVLVYAGGGNFTPSLLTATGAAPSAVVLADFDGDTLSLTDVAIASQDDDTITVYLNAGGVGGAWTGVVAQAPVPAGEGPIDLAIIDNDDDKDLDDIASINVLGGDAVLFDNNGGMLTAGDTIPVGDGPRFLLTADLDNDVAESLDLITADAQGQSLSIVLNQTGLGYAPSVQIPLDFVPRFVAAADLDSDGDRDLAVLAESGAPSNEITVLRNDLTSEGDLVLAQDAPIVLDAPIRFLIAGDIDNDGADDLIAITESSLRGEPGDPTFRHTMRRPKCSGDTNGDFVVDFTDLNAVLVGFGFSGDLPGDVTGDGLVNFEDLNAVLVAFGSSCR